MSQAKRLQVLMDSTNGVLLILLLFVIRATITVWPAANLRSHIYCVFAGIACITGIITNMSARKLLSIRSSN